MIKLLLNPLLLFVSLLALITFVSCGSNSESGNTTMATDSVAKSGLVNTDTAKSSELLSLPAPMQVASAIKRICPKYYENLLCPTTNGSANNFSKTLTLGMYAFDLGYANVYEQRQTSLNYFVTSIKLADELKIIGPVNASSLKSFKENINNNDSVKHYTLNSFGNIHDNLISSDRKNEAFLILTGSFIEGLYVCSSIQTKDKNLASLVGEQKLFLDNLVIILPAYKDEAGMSELIAQLADLKTVYDKIEIKYKEDTDPSKKSIEPITVSDDMLKQISEKIAAIRKSIIVPKSVS